MALFLSHDAVFLVQVGPGEALSRALRDAGHDYWGAASLILALVGLAVGATAALRLRWLRRRVALLRAPRGAPTPIGTRFAAVWLRLFAVVALGFVLQENVEHIISHGHAIGLGALLGPEYPLALPVIGLVTAIAGFVAAAVRRTEGALLAIISAALQRPRRGRSSAEPAQPARPAAPPTDGECRRRPCSSPRVRFRVLKRTVSGAERPSTRRNNQCSDALDGLPSSAPC